MKNVEKGKYKRGLAFSSEFSLYTSNIKYVSFERRSAKWPVLNIYQEFRLLFHHSRIYTDRRPIVAYRTRWRPVIARESRAYSQNKVEDENEIVK